MTEMNLSMARQIMIRGRYEILSQLGSGAQGRVFGVRDQLAPQTPQVMKVFGRDQASYALGAFEVLAQLASPMLPAVQGFFIVNDTDAEQFRARMIELGLEGAAVRAGQACLTRGFVDGVPAGDWAERAEDLEAVTALLGRVGSVLAQIHRAGFLHGDLKPDNVLVDEGGFPVLIDFGLSRAVTDRSTAGGTPLYLAPEVLLGKHLSTASERYTFGALAFRLLEGRPPYSADPGSVTRGYVEAQLPDLTVPIAARARTMIRQLLNKDPAERPQWDAVLDIFEPPEGLGRGQVMLPFVGRQEEIDQVLEQIEAGQSVWISGAPGSGKTRFLQRIRWHAELRGVTTIQVPRGPLSLGEKLDAVGRQLGGLSNTDVSALPHLSGDRVHQAATLRAWIDELVPSPAPILFWDDADLSGSHLAFLREYSRTGGSLTFLAAVQADTPIDGRCQDLGPLPADKVAECIDSLEQAFRLSAAARKRAVGQAEGNPRALQLALSRGGGRKDTQRPTGTRRVRLLTVMGSTPDPVSVEDIAAALDVSPSVVWEQLQPLLASGAITPLGEGYTLTRPLERLALVTGKDAAVFVRLAERLEGRGLNRSACVLRALAGDTADKVVDLALEELGSAHRAHFSFHLAGALVARDVANLAPRLVSQASELGMAEEALNYLEGLNTPAGRLSRARLRYTLGDLDAAKKELEALESVTLSLNQIAESAAISTWINLRQGEFHGAATRLNTAPAIPAVSNREIAAELATAHAAVSLLTGESDTPEEFRKAVDKLKAAGGMPQLTARLLTFQAMAATRVGKLERAQAIYQRALETVEQAGLDAHLPTFLLNLATSFDHLGNLERARHYYRRGSRLAGAHAPTSTRVLLIANQANISLRLRRWDEAGELIDRAQRVAASVAGSRASLFVEQLAAELAVGRAEWARAEPLIASLSDRFREQGDDGARCEIQLLAARVALKQQKLKEAENILDEAKTIITEKALAKHHTLALLVEGELEAVRDNSEKAAFLWGQAITEAHGNGNHFRVLEIAAEYAAGGTIEADDQDTVAESLQQIIVGLGPGLRADFMRTLPEALRKLHQERHRPAQAGTTQPSRPRVGEEILYRLLSLTARLARQTDYQRFLETAVDTAIELGGAERGFLLVRRDKGFRVAVSRDVDGEPIGKALLKVSRTIADQVAADGEPLLTVDARSDQRLGVATSVHRLSLTSVLCLPIRAFDQVIAVLYLDHRFRAGAFDQDVLRLMTAFTDQLAVAMVYIDRIRALETQNKSLQQANRKIEELLAEKEEAAELLQTRCEVLQSDLKTQRKSARLRYKYDQIVGGSPPMVRLLEQVDRLVDSEIPVLVIGESGTGKELVARAIHYNGPRGDASFVPINCGAIPESLIESELFGHKKGSFTGADRDHKGLFLAANKGTVFLDEVGELPQSAQVKLLRVLQERRVRPVGGVEDVAIDVRLIAATNRNLLEMVEQGGFRSDLYYRLAGVSLAIPPLRKRRGDIPLLVQHFLDNMSQERSRPIAVSSDAARRLFEFTWPGNVRQLENVLRAAMTFSDEGEIQVHDVDPLLLRAPFKRPAAKPAKGRRGPKPKVSADDLVKALRDCNNDITRVAERFSVTPRSIYRYLTKYQIEI